MHKHTFNLFPTTIPRPETAPSDAEAQAEDPALHVNVRKPKHALPLMRAANASAATVTTPWAPDLLEGRSDP